MVWIAIFVELVDCTDAALCVTVQHDLSNKNKRDVSVNLEFETTDRKLSPYIDYSRKFATVEKIEVNPAGTKRLQPQRLSCIRRIQIRKSNCFLQNCSNS
mmetsp:Transcript_9955/g.16532  ORF Transcript_9955/g.16532 Transcript_9955/m.16532 type:complete len:100 (+) Transcript_9955:233-532(+)